MKNVSAELLRDVLLDVCPNAEPAMVEIYDEKVYFYDTILWEKHDGGEIGINNYDLTYSDDGPQIDREALIKIVTEIVNFYRLNEGL